jgi:hypothetical protein
MARGSAAAVEHPCTRIGLKGKKEVAPPRAAYKRNVRGLVPLALAETIAVRSYQVLATSRLCANRALAGDWKSAYTYALEAVAVRKDIETWLLSIDLIRYFETEALLRGGDEESAREDVQRLGARISTNRRQRLLYLRALPTLAEFDGETREALASFQEAAVLANEIGLPGELWQIAVALGEVYASLGRERAEACSENGG